MPRTRGRLTAELLRQPHGFYGLRLRRVVGGEDRGLDVVDVVEARGRAVRRATVRRDGVLHLVGARVGEPGCRIVPDLQQPRRGRAVHRLPESTDGRVVAVDGEAGDVAGERVAELAGKLQAARRAAAGAVALGLHVAGVPDPGELQREEPAQQVSTRLQGAKGPSLGTDLVLRPLVASAEPEGVLRVRYERVRAKWGVRLRERPGDAAGNGLRERGSALTCLSCRPQLEAHVG